MRNVLWGLLGSVSDLAMVEIVVVDELATELPLVLEAARTMEEIGFLPNLP